MRNYLITYPRSGVNWTINRIKALIDITDGKLWPQNGGRFIRMNHLGFAPETSIEGIETLLDLDGREVFVILRDARQCLVSNWYFIIAHTRVKQTLNRTAKEHFVNLETFLKSPYATKKYCNFLNKINRIKKDGNIGQIYFYEDIQDLSFMYEIPKILGVNFSPAKKTVKQAQLDSNAVVNTFGTNHLAAKPETLEFVQEEMKRFCKLEEYRKRYLA